MTLKNDLLAYFWANANQVVTGEGIEIDLHNDKLVTLSIMLRNVEEEYLYTLQLHAEFNLDDFIAELEVQMVDSLLEIDLNLMFALLADEKATYKLFKA